MGVLDNYVVEVALDEPRTADLTSGLTWTDITDRVIETGDLERGRASSLAVTQPGRLGFVVSNDDGAFDPLNPSTPYPGMRPGTPIRVKVRETDSDSVQTTHTLFAGYLDAWRTTYAGENYRPQPLSATDALGAVFPRLNELTSEWEWQVRNGAVSTEVAHWYRLGEGFTVTAFDSWGDEDATHVRAESDGNLATEQVNTNVDPIARRGEPLVYGSRVPSTRFFGHRPQASSNAGLVNQGVDLPTAVAPGDTVYSYSFLMVSEEVVELGGTPDFANEQFLLYREGSGSTALAPKRERITLAGGSTVADWGKVRYQIYNASLTASADLISTVRVDDGQPHLISVTRNGASLWLMIDGIVRASTTGLGAVTWTGAAGLEGFRFAAIGFQNVEMDAKFSELVIYDLNVASNDFEHLFDAASTPLGLPTSAGDPVTNAHLPGRRATVILDRAGWPAGMRSVQDGAIAMLPADWDQRSPLELLRECEESENGFLAISRAGNLMFFGRKWRTDSTITAANTVFPDHTFTDDPDATLGPDTHRFVSFHLDHGERNLATRAAVPWRAGTVHDERLAAQYGDAERSLDGAAIDLLADATLVADQIVAEFSYPHPRAVLSVAADQKDIWKAVAELELCDRVVVSWRPRGAPGRFTAEWHVDKISARFGDGIDVYEADYTLRLLEGTLVLEDADTIAVDTFSRADSSTVGSEEGPSGLSWLNTTGWEVEDRQCVDKGSLGVPILLDGGSVDVDVSVCWPDSGNRRYYQLRSNAAGTSGLVFGWQNGTDDTFYISVIGGATLTTKALVGRDRDVVRVRLDDDNAKVWVNGVLEFDHTNASISAETGTHHGIRSTATARSTFDTFLINPL